MGSYGSRHYRGFKKRLKGMAYSVSRAPFFARFRAVYPSLVLGDVRQTGCGARLPRIAYSQYIGPQTGEYAPGSSNISEVGSFTVAVYAELMFVNACSVGGGGRAPQVHCAFAK